MTPWLAVFPAAVCLLGLLFGCGDNTSRDKQRLPLPPWTRPDPGIKNVPDLLILKGRFQSAPRVQVRNLGSSRMVQFSAVVTAQWDPPVPRLAEALELEKHQQVFWMHPIGTGCEISQVSLVSDNTLPGEFKVMLWGWDRQGEESLCEKLLLAAQEQGLSLALTKVGVKSSQPVPRLEFSFTLIKN